jgi:hypothetical protein
MTMPWWWYTLSGFISGYVLVIVIVSFVGDGPRRCSRCGHIE